MSNSTRDHDNGIAWSVMARSVRHFGAVVLGILATMSVAASAAGAEPIGFDVNRLEPSERGSDWFANESLDLRGSGRLALGVVGDYGYRPFVLYNGDGSDRTVIVRHQLFAHAGAGLILFDRVRLDVSLPIALYQDGDPGTLSGATYASTNPTTLADPRV